MKTVMTVLMVLLVIAVLLGVGLQMFLTRGLTTALNQGVFPAVDIMALALANSGKLKKHGA